MYQSLSQVCADKRLFAYHHLIAVAWKELELDSVLFINGLPTVYIHRSKKIISSQRAAELHQRFWNQGVAVLLIVIDPNTLHVYSAQARPANSEQIEDIASQPAHVESLLDLASATLWFDKLVLQLETGAYYQTYPGKFSAHNGVDDCLLRSLSATRDALTKGKHALSIKQAHAFLGRILFTCYLIDRGIIKLSEYLHFDGNRLVDWLDSIEPETAIHSLYTKLFPELRKRLNGSMFDDELEAEHKRIQPCHINHLSLFLSGSEGPDVRSHQRSLGFWAFEFQMIPVETISGIYEDFLKAEDDQGKHKAGAYYTPRLLAEMTLDVLLEGQGGTLAKKRFLDPSCGSGIFLVLLFNRLAAEWVYKNRKKAEDHAAKAAALHEIFQNNLRGVDINPTACRIACFSLYLAYLDQFDPKSIAHYSKTVGRFLPNLIVTKEKGQPKGSRKLIPVIHQADFLADEDSLGNDFDCIIGNPPWAQRGNSLEQRFMEKAPERLKPDATACLLVPSKVFFNHTSLNFQKRWIKKVDLEKVVLLADYRRILFAEAKCPCQIVRFRNGHKPSGSEKWIEFVAPKSYGLEHRKGGIPVSPDGRKWILDMQLRAAVAKGTAPQFWKSYFWGSPRDRKLLALLHGLPKLNQFTGTPAQVERGEKRWAKGQGFQPLYQFQIDRGDSFSPNEWDLDDPFVAPSHVGSVPFIPLEQNSSLRSRLEALDASKQNLRRSPNPALFSPPLILFNQGFSKAAFFDYPVRFQDSLQSIAGKPEDEDLLLFLTAYLKSKLAYYYIFHSSANIGMERTKAHLEEVLRLPFYLPEDEYAPDNAKKLVQQCARLMRGLKDKLNREWAAIAPKTKPGDFTLGEEDASEIREKWTVRAASATEQFMNKKIDPLMYEYFGLIDQEIAMIEDTSNILRSSITPQLLDDSKGIRKKLDDKQLTCYADTLIQTLSAWMHPDAGVSINAKAYIHPSLGLAKVELIQSKRKVPTKFASMSDTEALAYLRLEGVSADDAGSLRYLRNLRLFEGKRIQLFKPARLGFWMRSTAVNDASVLHADIQHQGDSTP